MRVRTRSFAQEKRGGDPRLEKHWIQRSTEKIRITAEETVALLSQVAEEYLGRNDHPMTSIVTSEETFMRCYRSFYHGD